MRFALETEGRRDLHEVDDLAVGRREAPVDVVLAGVDHDHGVEARIHPDPDQLGQGLRADGTRGVAGQGAARQVGGGHLPGPHHEVLRLRQRVGRRAGLPVGGRRRVTGGEGPRHEVLGDVGNTIGPVDGLQGPDGCRRNVRSVGRAVRYADVAREERQPGESGYGPPAPGGPARRHNAIHVEVLLQETWWAAGEGAPATHQETSPMTAYWPAATCLMAFRMRKYVPHRHRFPPIAWSMSASVG